MAKSPIQTVLPRRVSAKATSATAASRYQKGGDIQNLSSLSAVDGQTVRNLRDSNQIISALRLACRLDGTLSTAVYDLVQVANTQLRLRAYDSSTHEFSPEGTAVARNILAMTDSLYDYTVGFSDRRPIDSVKETALRECILTGAVAGELVLDKALFPERIQIVPFETLTFKSRGDGTKYPVQRGLSAEEIVLDLPTFWIIESHLGADSPYPRSMLEASLPTLFYLGEYIEDMRRANRRTGHSRLVITLDAERVRLAAPEEAKKSEEGMRAYMESIRNELASVVSSLEPEDALVVYDVASGQDLSNKGERADYSTLLTTLAGMAATSLKSNPSILGLRAQGSQSLSNTESLVFLQVARAAQTAVSALFSRAMTLATRLYGVDVYVKTWFSPINLRPDDELEPYKTMRQDRILKQLSLGLISDEDAVEELNLPTRPPGAPKLSGTFFLDAGQQNRASEVSPNTDPMGRALQPNTPKKAGGSSQ